MDKQNSDWFSIYNMGMKACIFTHRSNGGPILLLLETLVLTCVNKNQCDIAMLGWAISTTIIHDIYINVIFSYKKLQSGYKKGEATPAIYEAVLLYIFYVFELYLYYLCQLKKVERNFQSCQDFLSLYYIRIVKYLCH